MLYLGEYGRLVIIAAKTVDDLRAAGQDMNTASFIKAFNKKLELGTTANGPGEIGFFGLSIEQTAHHTIRTDVDDKLRSLGEHKIS